VLGGCATTPPGPSEPGAPLRLDVMQQPADSQGRGSSFYVLCTHCPGPTPKTPFIGQIKPDLRHPVTVIEPVEHEAGDKIENKSGNIITSASAGQAKILFTAHFAFGTARLSAADKHALSDNVSTLKHRSLHVAGYTDNAGPQDFNDWLALRRAQSVKAYLITLGLDPETIEVEGHGKCCYLQDNDSPSDRTANRRAEIRIDSFVQSTSSETPLPINQPGDTTP